MAITNPLKGIDIATDPRGHLHDLQAAGIECIGIYLRSDRISKRTIDDGHGIGMKWYAFWERGFPTSPVYFTAGQGTMDAERATNFAPTIGMPHGQEIFYTCDYDSNPADVEDYFKAAHEATRANGYLCSGYGNTATGERMMALGYCHSWILSQSHGFKPYNPDLPGLSGVQGPETTIANLSCDGPNRISQSVCW